MKLEQKIAMRLNILYCIRKNNDLQAFEPSQSSLVVRFLKNELEKGLGIYHQEMEITWSL